MVEHEGKFCLPIDSDPFAVHPEELTNSLRDPHARSIMGPLLQLVCPASMHFSAAGPSDGPSFGSLFFLLPETH